jgi:creatinine amidohydrolase
MAHMTMEQFSRAMGRGDWLLLPLGTTEEHGVHLPLGTDTMIAEHVCREVARRCEGVVAPALPYGLCRSTRNFPGTVSVSFHALESAVGEVLSEYVRHGARRIAVVSGHGGAAHMEAVRLVGQRLVDEVPGLLLLAIGPNDLPLPLLPGTSPRIVDGHAGATETSVLLAIHPDCVRSDRLPPGAAAQFPACQVLAHPEDAFPGGVIGDPTAASGHAGAAVLEHAVAGIVELLRRARASLDLRRPCCGSDPDSVRPHQGPGCGDPSADAGAPSG